MVSQRRNWVGQLIEPIVAAVNPFAGGNSRLARSLRARRQPRDRKGRWIRTGVGFGFDINVGGKVFQVLGTSAGPSSREGVIQVYIGSEDSNLAEGFYEVESGKGDVAIAQLKTPEVQDSRVSVTNPNVIPVEQLQRKDAPEGWDFSPESEGQRRWVSQDRRLEIVYDPETNKVILKEDGRVVAEEDSVPRAFAESDRRDVEQSITKNSKKIVARLRKKVEDLKEADDTTPTALEEARENVDRALFDDPDYEETLELVDSAPPDPDSLGESVFDELSEEDIQNLVNSPFTGPHMEQDENGRWRFKPKRWQQLKDMVQRKLAESNSTPVDEPVQYHNGGGPGSGKSTLTKGTNKNLTGYPDNAVLIDPDEMKLLIPEAAEALARINAGEARPGDENWAADGHEESSLASKMLQRAANDRHHNVIIDGTGDGKIESVRKKVQDARDRGYKRVEANYLYLDVDEGLKRAKQREKKTGRKVPETTIKKTYASVSDIFPQLVEERLFDVARLFDNNVPEGREADPIFVQDGDENKVFDEEAYDRFKAAKVTEKADSAKVSEAKEVEVPEAKIPEKSEAEADTSTDPDSGDTVVVSLEGMTDQELNSELRSIQERYQDLQFKANNPTVAEEIQRIADRYTEVVNEIGRRQVDERVDEESSETIESLNTRIESVKAQIGRRIIQGRATADLDERHRNLVEKREKLQRGEQVDDTEETETDGGTEGTVPRGVAGAPSRSARVERRGDSLRDVSGNVVATRISEPSAAEELREKGVRVVELFEVNKEQAELFRDSLVLSAEANAFGGSVTVYDLDYYQQDGVRMFITQDGLGGVALNGDEIVSGFMHPDATDRGQGAVISMISSMVDQGGRRLEAFDTILPGNYSIAGFRPVARLRWDNDEKPDGWDFNLYKRWNGGKPDVVFMAYDPERFGSEYDPTEGEYIEDYSAGEVSQRQALESIDEARRTQVLEERRERARARRMETQKQNDELKQEDGLLVGDVPRNDKDKPKNQALILAPIGQVVEVTSRNGRKMRFIKVGRDIWKRSDKPNDHTRYRSHQIRRDKMEFVETKETDIPSLDFPPKYHNSWRPVPYSIPRSASDEELSRLRSIYQREADTADNSINAQRADETVRLLDRIAALREGRTPERRASVSDRIVASRPRGRRQNAPILGTNDAESGSVGAHKPAKPQPDENGVTDNPELLANIFDQPTLTSVYLQALTAGRDSTMMTFRTEAEEGVPYTGTQANVPITALRDALQLQGVDTNRLVESARIIRENRASIRDREPVTASDVRTHLTRQEELENLYKTKKALEDNERLAVVTEPAGSSRLTSIRDRLANIRNRIRRLELEGFRITEMPSADSIEGFVWNSSTTPDIYRPGLIMDALQTYYPNAELNSDGELIVGVAEHTVILDGVPARFRYEAIITKTDDEQFYTYIRETNLSDENPATRSRSMRYGNMRQSARAVNNEAVGALNKISNKAKRSNIHSWFNDRRRAREGRAPKFDIPDEQGVPHHKREGVLTRESILKIQAAMSEDEITEEMIGTLYNYLRDFGNDTGVLQALYSSFGLDAPTLNRFVDEVNQHVHERDGLNSFSFWESNNGTPLAEGDLVSYVGDRRQRGYERLAGRQAIVKIRSLEHTSNNYTYTDYVQVQLLNADGTPDDSEEYVVVSSHNLRLDRTSGNTDGSERRGPDAISMPLPVLTTRAGNRYAGQGRLGSVAPFVTEYDRDTLASPTVEIDGVQYPVQASRQSLLGPDLANIYARPRDLQTGDFIMHFDPETSSRRLVEVVNVETLENGNIKLTTVEPINLTSARVSQTEFGPDEVALDIYRYDPNFVPDEETLTDAHVGRIREAARNVRLDELPRETMITVNRLLNFDLESDDLTINEYREAMLDMLNNRTDEGLAGPVSVAEARRVLDVAMNRALPNLTARNNIQAVSNAATQRATEIGVDSGQTTTPTGGVPVASTPSPSTSISPNSLQRGPFSDEDGVVPGLTKQRFQELVTGVGSTLSEDERKAELERIVLESLGGRQYGSVLTLTDFTFSLSNRSFTWHAKGVDPTKTGKDGKPLKVARVSRNYRMETLNSGEEVFDVHHSHVFVDIKEYKGTGFATEFYQVSDNFYTSLVDINTIQTVQDGSYAWGAANFTWHPGHGRSGIAEIRSRLLAEASKYETSNPVMASKLQDLAKRLNKRNMLAEDYPDPIDIASLLDPDDAERREAYSLANDGDMKGYKTLGRRMLQGTNWYGIRYINSDLDPRPENRKNKKTLREQQKEKAKKDAEELEKSEKAKKEAEERQKSAFSPPQGRTITSLNDVSNATPGDVVQVTQMGYEAIYIKQEDGSWDEIYYGSSASSPTRSNYTDEDLDLIDDFSGDIKSARIFSTPEEQEYFSRYAEGTLTLENPTREVVERALRDEDIVTLDALYRGTFLANGQKKFGRGNFTFRVTNSRMENRGTNYNVYEVGGDILDENGRRIGPFRREIRMTPDGKLEMYHSILKIEEEGYRRTGFGKDFTKQSEELYKQMGVDTIRLGTAWEGSYFWATQGYEWDTEHEGGYKYAILAGVPDALELELERAKEGNPPRPKDVAALKEIIERMAGLEIDDPNFPSPREIAMLKSQDPSLNDDGNGGDGGWMQKILHETNWYGKKRFS